MRLIIDSTVWGWIGLAVSGEGLAGLVLPRPSREQARCRLVEAWPDGVEGDAGESGALLVKLRRYFEGGVVRFDERLDLTKYPTFYQEAWQVVSSIPYGETRTYAQVAVMAGCPKASRAVGNAMAANPLPIIVPCHRVVRSDGTLGNYADDPNMKKRLLQMECTGTELAIGSYGNVVIGSGCSPQGRE